MSGFTTSIQYCTEDTCQWDKARKGHKSLGKADIKLFIHRWHDQLRRKTSGMHKKKLLIGENKEDYSILDQNTKKKKNLFA